MQEAIQQKKPKSKRRPLQQVSWGLLGQAHHAGSLTKCHRDSAQQQQPAADSPVPSGSPPGSGDEPGTTGGDGANMDTSVAQAGDVCGDAETVQCHGLLPAGGLNDSM